jgi:hypothetical protein
MPDYTCDECGDDLKMAEESTKEVVRIEPCETCRNESYDIGYREAEEEYERRHVKEEIQVDPLLKDPKEGGEDNEAA